MIPLLQRWVETDSGLGWRTDPRALVSFAIALLEGGETRSGRWLANHLFGSRPPKSEDAIRRQPALALDEYWYAHELPRLVPALAVDALSAVSGWLKQHVQRSGRGAEGGPDYSGIIRPSIRSGDDSTLGAEDALVDSVRDLSLAALQGHEPDGGAGSARLRRSTPPKDRGVRRR